LMVVPPGVEVTPPAKTGWIKNIERTRTEASRIKVNPNL